MAFFIFSLFIRFRVLLRDNVTVHRTGRDTPALVLSLFPLSLSLSPGPPDPLWSATVVPAAVAVPRRPGPVLVPGTALSSGRPSNYTGFFFLFFCVPPASHGPLTLSAHPSRSTVCSAAGCRG